MTTAVQVQYRRGSSSQLASFTGAPGEMVVDTTNNRVVVQDGSTAGGWPAAKLSEVVTNTRTAISDSAYAALTTDRTVAYTAISAARVVTLPSAASYPTGTALTVVDESGSCSATNTITLARAGSDMIDGATAVVISSAYGYVAIHCNGSGKWTIVDQSTLSMAQQAAGAVAISGGTIDGVTVGSTTPAAASVTAPAAGNSSTRAITSAWYGQNMPGGSLNKFRNPGNDVDQRGTRSSALTITTSGGYVTDGWIVLPTGASVTAQQAASQSGMLSANSLKVTGASSVTDIIAKQRIESTVAAPFAGQTVTVQAKIYNNTGGSITPTLTVKHATGADNWGGTATDVSAANLQACANAVVTIVAYTFAASASSGNGIEIAFDFGNNFSTTGKTAQISDLDIRVTPGVATGQNSSPPPPELRPIFTELPANQRYFVQWSGTSINYASGVSVGTTGASGGIQFAAMRVAPTITFTAANTFLSIQGASTNLTPSAIATLGTVGPQSFLINVTISGGTTQTATRINDAGSGTSSIQASAEL
jgi:hypothetical protein